MTSPLAADASQGSPLDLEMAPASLDPAESPPAADPVRPGCAYPPHHNHSHKNQTAINPASFQLRLPFTEVPQAPKGAAAGVDISTNTTQPTLQSTQESSDTHTQNVGTHHHSATLGRVESAGEDMGGAPLPAAGASEGGE